jgi:ABC-type multidrug transport system ATPase subunit
MKFNRIFIIYIVCLFALSLDHQYSVSCQSGSVPVYYKNGTYCTTWLVDTPPLIDNPCQNGGTCDGDTMTCICQDGWTNNATLGYMDCRIKQCLQGSGPDPINNKCTCQEGWEGYQCERCTSDLACANANLTHVDEYGNVTQLTLCDTSYYTKQRKTFKCDVTEPFIANVIGNVVSIQCQNISFEGDGTSFENGICTFQSWTESSGNLPAGYEINAFHCSMSGCTGELSATDENYVAYACETTRCTCSGYSDVCSTDIQDFIYSMLGWAKISCNKKTNACLMAQKALGTITVEMTCTGAECVAAPIPDPPKPKNQLATKGIIAGVLIAAAFIVFLIVCIIIFILSMVHNKQLASEWKKIKDLSAGALIVCDNLSYTITSRDWLFRPRRKKILDNVSCTIRPGRLVALMGESGSGKTTLLDILAMRNKRGAVKGTVTANDKPLRKWKGYKRLSAYVSQDDRLMGTLTVRESLMFAADVKIPGCVTNKEKRAIVDNVLQKLSIDHVAERRIGTATKRGISGGEKRRVSIAMELVHNPQVLFLDEPTSGLDAASAFEVCQYLKEMTSSGKTVVLSIHQPRSNIFNMFDDIILMNQGCVAYAGPAKDAASYFQAVTGKPCPSSYNPADYLLDVVFEARKKKEKLLMKSREEVDLLVEKQQSDPSSSSDSIPDVELVDEKSLVYELKETTITSDPEITPTQIPLVYTTENDTGSTSKIDDLYPYATSFTGQLKALSRRSFLNFYRNISLLPTNLVGATIVGIILGAIFSGKLSTSLEDTQTKVGIFFIEMFILSFICLSSIELCK